MALNSQVHIYSVDTSSFYTEKEKIVHKKMNKMHLYRAKLKKKKILSEHEKKRIKLINKVLKTRKESLLIEMGSFNGVRELDKSHIKDSNIISVFESTLTRTIGLNKNDLSEDIMIVQVYYFQVFENIVKDGFLYNGEKYCIFTASAGQIRTKKAVFIKESLLKKHKNTIFCGIDLDRINKTKDKNGNYGTNENKYLAYLALVSSATDVWEDFDIDKSIVVNDLETLVRGKVDYINDETYEIESNKLMDIEINHTDGCGMFLPSVDKTNRMIRLPWVKGLMSPFPYDKMIREAKRKKIDGHENCQRVIDIYGKEWDIFEDDIKFIFTKSQFKMHGFYKDWEEYKSLYKKYNCECGIANVEMDFIKNARFNYQMLQSLTDMESHELDIIVKETNDRISNIGKDRDITLKVLGATDGNMNKNYIQKSLALYPELVNDNYSKEILKQLKKSMVKDARSAKLNIDCKYTFIVPDLYAFCEYLFFNNKNPNGILQDGEISCRVYKNVEELDCLRSPSLYKEHAVRKNVVNENTKRWFQTNATYVSVHDLISRVLQFDVDGDNMLNVAEPTIVEVAKRNMKDIVPLYYTMKKANPSIIDNSVIYNGMVKAYTGGNIGIYSNNISKVWNSDNPNNDVVKYLCMENNYVIDYAKTLYKPTRPKHIDELIKSYTKKKVPHFFIYAKNKDESMVEKLNNSTVNKLYYKIKNPRLSFNKEEFGMFDYRTLKHNTLVEFKDDSIINKYNYLNKRIAFKNHKEKVSSNPEVLPYAYQQVKDELISINNDVNYVIDVLIEYLYGNKNTNSKLTLWETFGDIIYENIKQNLGNTVQCEKCKCRILKTASNNKYCSDCKKEKQKEWKKKAKANKNNGSSV